METLNEAKEAMKIIFEGKTHQIEADTLIHFLTNYKAIVDAANRELGDGTKETIIKINALREGCFVIDIELVQNVIVELFSHDTLSYLSNLSQIVGTVYLFHKAFKGKPTDNEKAKAELLNTDSATIINITDSIVNVYNQQPVREALSKSLEITDKDPAIEGLRIENKKGTVVSISKKEFKELSYFDFASEEVTTKEKVVTDNHAILSIRKVSFVKGESWSFIYNGNKIGFVVKNTDLIKYTDEGARFAKGDHIRVKLEILQVYNKQYRSFVNKSYKIIEFYEHIKSPEQGIIAFTS